MIYAILLIILGLVAIPSLVLAKKPEAKEYLDQIAPYQGWMGLGFCIIGIFGVIGSILSLGFLAQHTVWWATNFAVAIVEVALGFIVGFSKISELLLSKNEESKKKGQEILAKLLPFQEKLGIAAIILGIWGIVSSILFAVAS